ncbi:MAG: DNA mismatch repair endonuclease MutL [Abditibacteriota bacterium]|nr:DNA mismatch repair endonuclease MutL [Abditibacteriota bacterium]
MSDAKINILDDITASQIAAGEVVERPLSVVKELCENSIDAGADAIKIEIENGGQTYIRVTDNGCGMSETDAVMCLSRHATSKIRSADDLSNITTLGFRGEAVPSIASVSRMVIETCDNPEGNGVRITVSGGEPESVERIAFSRGTRITVRDLFYNVPARRKFMKTASSEQNGILGVISQLAIGEPGRRFELVNLIRRDRGEYTPRRLLLSAPGGNLLNAITSVLGADTARDMVYFSETDGVSTVSGYVSTAQGCRGSRRDEYMYVNGRCVKNRKMLYMAELPYKTLAPGKYPAAVIFVTLPPGLVDVNVHPAKSEVNFSNESQISGLIHKGVTKAVSGSLGSLRPAERGALQTGAEPEKQGQSAGQSGGQERSRAAGEYRRTPVELPKTMSGGTDTFRIDLADRKEEGDPFAWGSLPEQPAPAPIPGELKVIGQYRNTYIICSSDKGIIVIDQHVAHERILYESFEERSAENTGSQLMLMPETISCSMKDAAIVNARMEELSRAGYVLEDFGAGSFIMRGYPACLTEKNAKSVLQEIISDMSEEQGDKKLVIKPERVLIYASCRMAIKAGDKLSQEEMQTLVDELVKCRIPNTCPHGRPILMSITDYDLDKAFQRI